MRKPMDFRGKRTDCGQGETPTPPTLSVGIFGTISEGQTAPLVTRALLLDPCAAVTIDIDSSGGSSDEAKTLYDAISRHQGWVTARIRHAASAAAVVMLAADEILIGTEATVLLHEPTIEQLFRADAQLLRRGLQLIEEKARWIATTTARRSGLRVREVRELMKAAAPLTAKQALKRGLCDRIESTIPASSQAWAGTAVQVAWRSAQPTERV